MESQQIFELLTNQKLIIDRLISDQSALIRYSSDERPVPHFRKVLALDTAASDSNPEIVSFPFNGYAVEDATDDTVSVKLAVNSISKESTQQYKTLKNNDSADSDTVFRKGVLMWDAQAGKTLTIVFFLGVKFRPGSLRSVISGGVVVTTGSGMTPQTKVSVVTSATSIVAADANRKKVTFQNLGANDVFISGTSAVTLDTGTKPGIKLEPGDLYEYVGQGAIYGIARGAASNISIQTET